MSEPWYTAAFGAHYLALYAHRDDAEARECVHLLAGAGLLAAPTLDLGCGDGRHLALLESAVGVDYSAPLLAAARRRLPSAPLLRADMRALPLTDGTFATVLSLFTAFGYFEGDENERPAAEAARVLRPGGHWILDLFDGDRVRAELDDGRVHRRRRSAGVLDISEERRFDRASRTVCKHVALAALPGHEAGAAEFGIGPEGLVYEERVRAYDLGEIDALAERHGLLRAAAWGGYAGEALGDGARWILAYRRARGREGRP